MTFSIAGRCAKSGAFGVAITTSSIAVGARCPHARAKVGATISKRIVSGVPIATLPKGGLPEMNKRHKSRAS